MRPPYVYVIALAVAVILLSQPVAALPALEIPYLRAGPVWHLNPTMVASLFILETNTSHLAASDTEALAISFEPSLTGSPGGFTFAPTIAQTSSRAIAGDQTYLFRDFSVAV